MRFVPDAGFDDRKWFAAVAAHEFAIRACHFQRRA